MAPGAPFTFCVLVGEADELSDDDFPGRWLSLWEPARLIDVLQGAGFDVDAVWTDRQLLNVTGVRAHAVADTVAEGMHLVVCVGQPRSSGLDEPGPGIFHVVNRVGDRRDA